MDRDLTEALRAADRAAGRAGLQVFWIWERMVARADWAPTTKWKRLAGPFMFREQAEQLLRERCFSSTWEHQVTLVEGDGLPVLPEDEAP